jgi:hypothetical protein
MYLRVAAGAVNKELGSISQPMPWSFFSNLSRVVRVVFVKNLCGIRDSANRRIASRDPGIGSSPT